MNEKVLIEWLEDLKKISNKELTELDTTGKMELNVQDILSIENGDKKLIDILNNISTFKIKTMHEHHHFGEEIEGTDDFVSVQNYINKMIPLIESLINNNYIVDNFKVKLPDKYSFSDEIDEFDNLLLMPMCDTDGGGVTVYEFICITPFVLPKAVLNLIKVHESWHDEIGTDAINHY